MNTRISKLLGTEVAEPSRIGTLQLPSPSELGLDAERYPAWRADQADAIRKSRSCTSTYQGILAPTGFGKTLTIVGHALWSKERTLIVVATKGLQDQIAKDVPGIHDVRGQGNYDCHKALCSVAEAPCHAGMRCELKVDGCDYFDDIRLAREMPLVVTNYQLLFHKAREHRGLGTFDRIVFDEAHNIADELAKFLTIHISSTELKNLGLSQPPSEDWKPWAAGQTIHCSSLLLKSRSGAKTPDHVRQIHHLKSLKQKLSTLAKAKAENWLLTHTQYGYTWDCIWPGAYAKRYLFKRASKFLLTSASIHPRMFQALAVPESEVSFTRYGSSFPVSRRPVYFYPTVKLAHNSENHELEFWLSVIDLIIDQRADRKGIIHTVSYDRAEYIRKRSRHSARMIGNRRREELPSAIAHFKVSRPGTVLVSPSITEGFDFPGPECEYIIIGKVPFGDTRSPIHRARSARHRNYGILETCIELRQAAGRGMRYAEDHCETFILDEQFEWLIRSFRAFFPGDFLDAVRHIKYLPPAPPPLPVPRKLLKKVVDSQSRPPLN